MKRGDSAHVKNKVANFIRSLRYSKTAIKPDQEPTLRSMERNVVESLFEGDVRELREVAKSWCNIRLWESQEPMELIGNAIQ